MTKSLSFVVLLACALACAPMATAQVDHNLSNQVGEAANAAGAAFVVGAKKIAEPFIVVGKTVIDGVSFVMLKTAQGIIYVAEDLVVGIEYLKEGAKFVIIKTAQGIRWVAVQAIKAGEIVFDAVVDLAELTIDGVTYVLIKLEDGVAFVVRETIKAGQAVIRGVKYVAKETAEGIIWISEKTWNAIKAGASWARDRIIIANIRTRLASALVAGNVGPDALGYFQSMSQNERASVALRRVATAALAASKAFNDVYTQGR